MLLELLPEKRIKTRLYAQTWQDVVKKSGQLLLDDNLIEPRYITAMEEAIIEYGPYVVIGEGIALLHARPEDGVKGLGLSLVTLKDPVEFGHEEHDPVRVAFALCTTDSDVHVQAIAELSEVLLQDNSVETIYELTKPREIWEYMEQVLVGLS